MLSDIDLPELPSGYRWKFYRSKASGSDILAIQKRWLGVWYSEEISFPSIYKSYGDSNEKAIKKAAQSAFRRFNQDFSRYYGTKP